MVCNFNRVMFLKTSSSHKILETKRNRTDGIKSFMLKNVTKSKGMEWGLGGVQGMNRE